MSTTLEQELLQAATRADEACYHAKENGRCLQAGCTFAREALSLRQRAAWVREHMSVVNWVSPDGAAFARSLTGPIPSETANPLGLTERQESVIAAAAVLSFGMDHARRMAHETAPADPKEGTGGATAGEAKPTGCPCSDNDSATTCHEPLPAGEVLCEYCKDNCVSDCHHGARP